jgi:DNA end-binding protein Ku
VLEQIRFQDQVVAWEKIPLPQTDSPRAKEILMATSFIDQLTEHFDPSDYEDTYHDKLMKLIKQKQKGEVVKVQPEKEVAPTKSADLMQMLRESLEKAKENPHYFQN